MFVCQVPGVGGNDQLFVCADDYDFGAVGVGGDDGIFSVHVVVFSLSKATPR